MMTLGIDLAAQEKKTASCAIEWVSGQALVELPVVGAPSGELIAAMQTVQWIGIDAPFGWPDAMVEAIHRYAHEGTWPAAVVSERLRYRATDSFVHEVIAAERNLSVWPLSVSSDRIAVCAWRCAGLLREFGEQTGWQLDRISVPGADGPPAESSAPVAERGVVEVYPAGALALWGFPFKGYKRTAGTPAVVAQEKRVAILAALEETAGSWLILSDDVRSACIQDDDAFDAFISSLIACAAATGRTLQPSQEQRAAAAREGWIHLPAPLPPFRGLGAETAPEHALLTSPQLHPFLCAPAPSDRRFERRPRAPPPRSPD
jgi:hypothetical protein